MEKFDYVIIGGGLAGSLMATMLGQRGYNVTLFERGKDIRDIKYEGGRSINLALSHRGLAALDKINARDKVQSMLIPMKGRMIHDADYEIKYQSYGKNDSEVINSVSRVDLNRFLLNEAEKLKTVSLIFEHKCLSFSDIDNSVTLENKNNEIIKIFPKAIIASDGAGSAIRQSMMRMDKFNYSQNFMNYGYKELEIPSGPNNTHLLDKNGLHIWPRTHEGIPFVMIALPNTDGSFTVTLFSPHEGNAGFSSLLEDDKINEFFDLHFKDIKDLMPNLVHDMKNNPTGNLGTIKCEPWNKGNAVLIGDAAHAIIPFYGQGMNAAFEDCKELLELVESGKDWGDIINEFSIKRKPNGDAIAQLSFDNFLEMRDGVADGAFLERKNIELKLYDTYDDIISKYASVTFHPELEYHIAKRNGDIMEEIILEAQDEFKETLLEKLDLIRERILTKYDMLID